MLLGQWAGAVIGGLRNLRSVARIFQALQAVKEAVGFALCFLQLFNIIC